MELQSSGQGGDGRCGRFVEDAQQGPGRSRGAALALLPIADGGQRHVDAAGKLRLGETAFEPDVANMTGSVALCLRCVLRGLFGDLLFGCRGG